MPGRKKRFSAAEKEEKNQLRRNPEADGFKPEADEEDLNQIEETEEYDNNASEDDDVKSDDEEEEEEAEDEEALEEEDSKEGSQSAEEEEESDSEFMNVNLEDIRKEVECPICLGIIKKTRTMMECLHRFCKECIDKSMRLGNNECPACRKHCASRRSFREDPQFDTIIGLLFKNIDSYEEQEITFHDDDVARKKQIQVSIAQVSQRQSEALGKGKSIVKETPVASPSRPQRIASGTRGRRKSRFVPPEAHDNNNKNKDKVSSSDEASVEYQRRKPIIRYERRSNTTTTSRFASSSSNDNSDKDSSSDEAIPKRKPKRRSNTTTTRPSSSNVTKEKPPRRGRSPRLAWGRGGTRSSNKRHGSNNNNNNNNNDNSEANSKSERTATRVNRFVEYLRSLESSSVEMDIHMKLISMDTKSLPNLTRSYLCCKSTLSVKTLRQYVAEKMKLNAEEIELLLCVGEDEEIQKMQSLKDDETLANLLSDYITSHDEYLIVVYRRKKIE